MHLRKYTTSELLHCFFGRNASYIYTYLHGLIPLPSRLEHWIRFPVGPLVHEEHVISVRQAAGIICRNG